MTSELILIVDDDPEARGFLTQALSQARYATLAASTGAEALALTQRTRPSLVLMDAVMPGLSGFEACARLKARPDLADIPVVFMTGLSDTDSVVEGFRAGGVDYVTKPVVLEELLARIHVHLANARVSLSARSALDVTGRALIAADPSGAVIWETPQAGRLLAGYGRGEDDALTAELTALLASMAASKPSSATAQALKGLSGKLQFTHLGGVGEEHFFRLTAHVEGGEEAMLRDALKLTAREADVLVWISRGKSNKDISEILNISARTVNKHLEQIFTKLGVENRAAAASIATRIMAAGM